MKKPELLSDKAGEASGYDLQQKVKILKTVIPVFTTNSAKMPLKTCP